jgi:hypothetical protein
LLLLRFEIAVQENMYSFLGHDNTVAQIPSSQDSATAVAELQNSNYELITSIG